MKIPKECPAFEIAVACFDSEDKAFGKGQLVIGEGYPQDEDHGFISCRNPNFPGEGAFPFEFAEIKPLNEAAKEMLMMIKV